MANAITTSITGYTKQEVENYFLSPLFLGENWMGKFKLYPAVKGSMKLDHFAALEKITKGQTGAAFNATNSTQYTQVSLNVANVEAEMEQYAKEFVGTVKAEALRLGTDRENVDGTVIKQIVSELMLQGVKRDFNRLMWFGDTGAASTDYNLYDGIWKSLQSCDNKLVIDGANEQTIITLSGAVAAGGSDVVIAGTTLSASGLTTGDTAASIATAIVAADGEATAVVGFPNKFRIIEATAGTDTDLTSGTSNGIAFVVDIITQGAGASTDCALATKGKVTAAESIKILDAVYDAAPSELVELPKTLYVSRAFADGYAKYLRGQGIESSFGFLQDGTPSLSYNGIPMVVRSDWDSILANDFGVIDGAGSAASKVRVCLIADNAVAIGTDFDSANFETWYSQDNKSYRFRLGYKAGAALIDSKMAVTAIEG